MHSNEDEQALLLGLGQALAKDRSPGLPLDVDELVHRARTWMTQQREKLQSIVCGSSKVRSLIQRNRLSEVLTEVSDLLLTYYGALPCGTISRLLVCWGIESFCSNEWLDKSR